MESMSFVANKSDLRSSIQRAMQDEIARHAAAMNELGTGYNALAPISVLPEELLANIFVELQLSEPVILHCTDDDKPPQIEMHHPDDHDFSQVDAYDPEDYGDTQVDADHSEDYDSPNYAWLVASRVCRQWRAIILDHPALWSNIFADDDPAWVLEMLRRSKRVPLSVTARFLGINDHARSRTAQVLERILEELPRIRHLTIYGPEQNLERIWQLMDNPAPLLESMRLRLDILDFSAAPVPAVAFGGQSPRLQCLKIHAYPLDWDMQTLPSTLRHLVLIQPKHPREGLVDLDSVLVILDGLTLLETLTLQSILMSQDFPTDNTELPPVARTISLPSLRSIDVTTFNILDGIHLLNHLSCPSLVVVKILGDFLLSCNRPAAPIISCLSRYTSNSPPIRTLSVNHDQREALLACSVKASPTTLEDPTFVLASPYHTDGAVWFGRFLNCACEILNFSGVRELSMRNMYPDQLTVQRRFLKRFEGVTDVDLRSFHARELLQLLQSPVERDGRDGGVDGCPMPMLRLLKMNRVDFGSAKSLVPLVDGLACRCASGAKVERLVIEQCSGLHSSGVEQLKNVVGLVEWDGHVEESFDEMLLLGDWLF